MSSKVWSRPLPSKMLVSKIQQGIVIDHITNNKSTLVLRLLDPGPDAAVVIATNVHSARLGRKDFIKIEGKYLTSNQIDLIGLIAPHATINTIADSVVKEKLVVKPPSELSHTIDCRNPDCASKGWMSRSKVVMLEPIERSYFECKGCGYRVFYEDAIKEILGKLSAGILFSKEKIQREVLELLLKKGGLRFGKKFTLKSGRESPYFVNLGSLTDGESLSKIRWVLAGHASLLLSEGLINDFDFVFGPAYKGINLATLACEGLKEYAGMNKRYLYDRKEAKLHGDTSTESHIVGAEHFKTGQRILIVDDTITTGQTKLDSMTKLRALPGNRLVGVVVLIDRQETAQDGKVSAIEQIRETLGVGVYPILTATDIYQMLRNLLSEAERDEWIKYYDQYGVVKLQK